MLFFRKIANLYKDVDKYTANKSSVKPKDKEGDGAIK